VFLKRQPKGRIDLACPSCGFVQSEPAAVVSTFCRSCGEHYRVRRGKVVARPGLKPSGIVKPLPTAPPRREPSPDAAPPGSEVPHAVEDSWLLSAEDGGGAPRPLQPRQEDEVEVGISAGAFFGFATPEEPEPLPAERAPGGTDDKESQALDDPGDSGDPGDSDDPGPAAGEAEGTDSEALPGEGAFPLGEKAVRRDELSSGSVAALIESQRLPQAPSAARMPVDYLPEEERRSGPSLGDIEARCFRCFHVQHVSRYAKSTQCERCSTYISLADYEIRARRSHTLRTRGNIVIRRRGGLRDCEIACHHLTVNGTIDARVDCSGDAVFRKSGRVRGHLHCRKLIVEKGAEIEFPDGAKAERAEIHGRLVGDLTCSEIARVHRSGSVSGRLVAASVEIRDGGRVEGETRVDPETSIAPNPTLGYNNPVIG